MQNTKNKIFKMNIKIYINMYRNMNKKKNR